MPELARQPKLPGVASVLSRGVPGAGAGERRRPPTASGAPSLQRPQQPEGPQQQQAPHEAPTFAQLQQSGRARPAPPTPAPQMAPQPGAGGAAYGAGPSLPPSSSLRDQLSSSLRSGLANPNPYNSDTVQSIDSALTGQLRQDYGRSRMGLEENLARRGLSASTFGGNEYTNLQDRENQALATMRAGLIQSAANAETAGRAQAQGAAQSNINADNQYGLSRDQLDLARELGIGGLDISRGQLDLSRELGLGNLDLSRQDLAQRGSQFDRDLGLRTQAQADSRDQFGQSLAQQLGLATMSDRTANRGIDSNSSQQQLDFLLRVAPWLAGGGTGGGTGGGGTGGGAGGGGYTPDPRTAGYGTYTDPITQQYGGRPPVSVVLQKWMEQHPGQQPPAPGSRELDDWWDNYQRSGGYQGGGGQTVNFGGRQYTPQEFEDLKRQHPELFGVQPGGGSHSLMSGSTSQISLNGATGSSGNTAPIDDATRKSLYDEAMREAMQSADSFAGGPGYFAGGSEEQSFGGAGPGQPGMTRQEWIDRKMRDSGFGPSGEWLGERSNMNPNAIWWDDPTGSPISHDSNQATSIAQFLRGLQNRPTQQPQQPRTAIYYQNGKYTDSAGRPLTYRNGTYYDQYGRAVS